MEIDLAAPITAVTVYPTNASVVRRATATIESAGEHILRISGLPASSLWRGSLRVSGHGPAGTRILGCEEAAEFNATPPEEALARLREEIARLKGAVALVNERAGILEEQRAWLRSLGEQTARSIAYSITRGTTRAEEASNVFAYASKEAERLAAEKVELDRQRDQLQHDLEARERESHQLGGTWPSDRIAASVRLEVATPGTVELHISYLVSSAAWRPRYDARVDVEQKHVRLTQQAIVTQQTGEDWFDVALAVSTAKPSAAVTLPDEPDPWYVDIYTPPPVPSVQMAARPMRMTRSIMTAAHPEEGDLAVTPNGIAGLAGGNQSYAEVKLAQADAERSGAAQIFHLAGGGNVPSDGSPHILGIGDHDLSCKLDFVAAPVIASGAHLRAVAANTTGHVLLPGELHIFHVGPDADEYVGSTTIDLTAENAELKLYLGVDDNVTVKRELIERDTDKGNLLQGDIRRVTIGYRVTLSNRTRVSQKVILKDRLPVPRHERIKLRVLDIRPQPSARTKLDQLTWELQLAPDEERRVEWRFVVELPADAQASGLPS